MSQDQFTLSIQEKEKLLEVARNSISSYLETGKYPDINESEITQSLKSDCGAFVTLHKDGALRGCIGRFVADDPLYLIVQNE